MAPRVHHIPSKLSNGKVHAYCRWHEHTKSEYNNDEKTRSAAKCGCNLD